MTIDIRLSQKLTTQLRLTPQLKLSIDILQLPLLELDARIQQELSENPTLEEMPPSLKDSDAESPSIDSEPGEDNDLTCALDIKAKDSEIESLEESWSEAFPNSLRMRPEDLQSRIEYLQALITKPHSLADHLHQEISFLDLDAREKEIAITIIGNIDERGYLAESIQTIAKDSRTSLRYAEAVLKKIQTLDPPGVAARNLKECLLIQLKQFPESSTQQNAMRILDKQIANLEKKKIAKIARALNLTLTETQDACHIIEELEPKPGRRFSLDQTMMVIPDLILKEKDGEWLLESHAEKLPRLMLSYRYKKMLKDPKVDKKTKDYIRQKIQQANGFIRAIQQRQSTIERIANQLIATQKLFLEKGVEFLKPLRLKDVAQATGLHESTISRTVQNKYIETPGGVIALKKFFSGAIPSRGGGVRSQASIRDRIRRLIERESSEKPLSDSQMTDLLKKEGIEIARRTVAKYREELRIPPRHERRNQKRL
jgi:RNA polymerase sigma-54 factor